MLWEVFATVCKAFFTLFALKSLLGQLPNYLRNREIIRVKMMLISRQVPKGK